MKSSLRMKLDWFPLLILIVSAFYTVWIYFEDHVLLKWQHFVGFFMIVVTALMFFIRHKLGILLLGLTIILGLFGFISLSPGITSTSIGKMIEGDGITFLRFQPIFILWALLHFVISGRYYVGIASAKYWKDIKSDIPYRLE